MTREVSRAELIRFLRTIQRPEAVGIGEGELDDRASLIDAGLLDSLAMIQIIAHLEEAHGIDFRGAGLDPESLESVGGILDLIEQRRAG